jgi:proliferating cell nuclear antigen PCNA
MAQKATGKKLEANEKIKRNKKEINDVPTIKRTYNHYNDTRNMETKISKKKSEQIENTSKETNNKKKSEQIENTSKETNSKKKSEQMENGNTSKETNSKKKSEQMENGNTSKETNSKKKSEQMENGNTSKETNSNKKYNKNERKYSNTKNIKNCTNIINDNKILVVKTTQTSALKQVIERIANVISDCCIVFIRPDEVYYNGIDDDYYEEIEDNEEYVQKEKKGNNEENETEKIYKKNKPQPTKTGNPGGIRILRLTEDKSILIKVNLDACNFEYFKCDEPKITIGVDMHQLHAMIRTISDDDPIVIYMYKNNRSILYIEVLNENNHSEESAMEINLLDICNPDMPLPQTKFDNKITIASDKFHQICKHLNNNYGTVEIRSVNNQITFKGKGDGGKITKTYKDLNYCKKSDGPDQVVQGEYELRSLMGFSKCNKLCNTIDIYLKNDFPLVLVISVATLGKMYVFLTPIESPSN